MQVSPTHTWLWYVIEMAKPPEKFNESQSCKIVAQSKPAGVRCRYLLKVMLALLNTWLSKLSESFCILIKIRKPCFHLYTKIYSKNQIYLNFIWYCGNVAKIKFRNERTFLEAFYYKIKVMTKSQLSILYIYHSRPYWKLKFCN